MSCSEKAREQALQVLKHFNVRVALADVFSRCQVRWLGPPSLPSPSGAPFPESLGLSQLSFVRSSFALPPKAVLVILVGREAEWLRQGKSRSVSGAGGRPRGQGARGLVGHTPAFLLGGGKPSPAEGGQGCTGATSLDKDGGISSETVLGTVNAEKVGCRVDWVASLWAREKNPLWHVCLASHVTRQPVPFPSPWRGRPLCPGIWQAQPEFI